MKNYLLSLLFCIGFQFVYGQTSSAPEDDSFSPLFGKRYVLSGWVRDDVVSQPLSYSGKIELVNTYNGSSVETFTFEPSGQIIEGWQRIVGEFTLEEKTDALEIKLISKVGGTSYFDDIRILPYNGNMKSFVYDPQTQRLMAELDENNYATLYEYDREGGLVRVKKETEEGIYTIQETRSSTSKLNDE